jgi:uncharacterized protein YodC (DUF2158 family)
MKQEIKVGDVVLLKAANVQSKLQLAIGDTVCLNSGSPDLTVTGMNVAVEWKNEKGEMQTATFPRECLTLQVVPEDSRCDL